MTESKEEIEKIKETLKFSILTFKERSDLENNLKSLEETA